MGRTFSSLHTRNFRLFFIGQLISNTGNWLTIVALTLLVLHLTGSGVAVGAVAACQYGPILLLSAWAGAIADRSNKLRLLKTTQALEMCQSFALGALAFQRNPPLTWLFVTAAAGGVLLAFDNPVRRSFVTEMVASDEIPNAVLLYSALVNASRIFGPALAGLLVVTVGYGWSFTLDATSYVAVLVALFMMRPAELRTVPVTPRGKGQVRAGIRYVSQVPDLWIPFAMLGVIGLLGYNFSVVLPLLVEHSLGGGDGTFTLVYSVYGLGALVSALVAAHRNRVSVRVIVVGSLALGSTMLVLSAVPNIATAFPVVFVLGVASLIYMTATTAIVQVRADPAMHGRVLALQSVLLIGTTPIGGPILGWVADLINARAPLVLGGVATISAGVWGWWTVRRLHVDEAPRPVAEPELSEVVEASGAS
ncbi:MAG TPA: MFS transporter [Acidimicrobiales bacterium]|jgi:MFS family permease|nr:MFS transporter [Acidimicrobiales bacterium]